MIKFNDVPIEAWKGSQEKWALCLLHDECDWDCCSVCDYVFDISSCSSGKSGCPLIISGWCCAIPEYSKLHKDCTIDSDRWEKRVENYLWWIDLEIEAMEDVI